MHGDEIVSLPSGEATIATSVNDLYRASAFLAELESDEAQGHAADLTLAAELLEWLGSA